MTKLERKSGFSSLLFLILSSIAVITTTVFIDFKLSQRLKELTPEIFQQAPYPSPSPRISPVPSPSCSCVNHVWKGSLCDSWMREKPCGLPSPSPRTSPVPSPLRGLIGPAYVVNPTSSITATQPLQIDPYRDYCAGLTGQELADCRAADRAEYMLVAGAFGTAAALGVAGGAALTAPIWGPTALAAGGTAYAVAQPYLQQAQYRGTQVGVAGGAARLVGDFFTAVTEHSLESGQITPEQARGALGLWQPISQLGSMAFYGGAGAAGLASDLNIGGAALVSSSQTARGGYVGYYQNQAIQQAARVGEAMSGSGSFGIDARNRYGGYTAPRDVPEALEYLREAPTVLSVENASSVESMFNPRRTVAQRWSPVIQDIFEEEYGGYVGGGSFGKVFVNDITGVATKVFLPLPLETGSTSSTTPEQPYTAEYGAEHLAQTLQNYGGTLLPSYVGRPYETVVQMEAIPGVTAEEAWQSGIMISRNAVEQAREELVRLHNLGFTHGDVRAPNIMITPQGDIRLIDPIYYAQRSGRYGVLQDTYRLNQQVGPLIDRSYLTPLR